MLCKPSYYSEFMELPNGPFSRLNTITTNREKLENPDPQMTKEDDYGYVLRPNHVCR